MLKRVNMFQNDLKEIMIDEKKKQEDDGEGNRRREKGSAAFQTVDRDYCNKIPVKSPGVGYYRVNHRRVDKESPQMRYVKHKTKSKKVRDMSEPALLMVRLNEKKKGFIDF